MFGWYLVLFRCVTTIDPLLHVFWTLLICCCAVQPAESPKKQSLPMGHSPCALTRSRFALSPPKQKPPKRNQSGAYPTVSSMIVAALVISPFLSVTGGARGSREAQPGQAPWSQ